MAEVGGEVPVKRRPAQVQDGKAARRVWCAYAADGSCFVLFGQELTAMRFAVEHHLDGCRAVEFGVPLMDQIK